MPFFAYQSNPGGFFFGAAKKKTFNIFFPSGGRVKQTPQNSLVEKLTQISNDAGFVAKTGKNASQGFNFRGIDAVVNALVLCFDAP